LQTKTSFSTQNYHFSSVCGTTLHDVQAKMYRPIQKRWLKIILLTCLMFGINTTTVVLYTVADSTGRWSQPPYPLFLLA